MKRTNLSTLNGKHLLLLLSVLCFVFSCANRGVGPQGGPQDFDPPKMVKSKPGQNARNYKQPVVEVEFDELIQVQDIFKNVVISPPQKKAPVIRATGRKISVQLIDSLLSNTTYTIDFGNSIMDNNEKNILEDFSFAFSTGDAIDTLTITGILVDAKTLDPMANVYVGIYDNLSDTAFVSNPFLRITKTNEKGEFYVKNVKDGDYHVFALDDQNSNYYFDQPAEAIAFLDSIVNPVQVEIPVLKTDTLHADSLLIDSIATDTLAIDSNIVKFKNYNIILYQFNEEFKNQYLVKSERKSRENFSFIFNAPVDELPVIEPLNFEFENNYLLQQSTNNDSLSYWITDSALIKLDTLSFILHYQFTDSIGELAPKSDTLNLRIRDARQQTQTRRNRKDEEKEQDKPDYFQYTTNSSKSPMEYYDNPRFVFSAPVRDVDKEKIHMQVLVDTTWTNMPYEFLRKDSIGLNFELQAKLETEKSYRIQLDSAAITSIYDKVTEEKTYQFKLRPFEEYSTLIINLSPFDEKIVLELLNEKDEVLRQEKATEDGTFFEYLTPGNYFLRLFIDENMNGKWDTGNYKEKRQPEKVYYFNKKMSLRANWDVEEDWEYLKLPVLQQKPEELKGKTTSKKK